MIKVILGSFFLSALFAALIVGLGRLFKGKKSPPDDPTSGGSCGSNRCCGGGGCR